MKPGKSGRLLVLAAAASLAACGSMGSRDSAGAATGGSARSAGGPDASDTMTVLFPAAGARNALQSGCWATFYDERNFGGDSTTLVGPIELTTLDRGSARQLRREIKSVETGPRATLIVYERQLLSARSVGFPPASREPGLIEKLGFGGRIESMRLQCS